ncbi:MAG: nitrogen fixation protein NifQ [Methylococcales bacterium]|nr:nitrogen fixation protein NifQ [Methylococcales bacterium]
MSAALQPSLDREQEREDIYARLAADVFVTPNHAWLACIMASWCAGQSVLPDCLGLDAAQFNALTEQYFPGCDIPESAASGSTLDFSRMLEKEDLVNLLNHYGNPEAFETDWVIDILVAACLGNDHLWQDLGLWSRTQLSDLLHYNFPDLAAKNDKDMKWKKFLYKQLCEAEGLYLCRAPSCSVCIDYPKCYGAEE